MKKKLLTVLLALTMVLSVAACGKTEEAPQVEEPVVEEPAVEEPAVEEPAVEEPVAEESAQEVTE